MSPSGERPLGNIHAISSALARMPRLIRSEILQLRQSQPGDQLIELGELGVLRVEAYRVVARSADRAPSWPQIITSDCNRARVSFELRTHELAGAHRQPLHGVVERRGKIGPG